jgi:hypothetical protein
VINAAEIAATAGWIAARQLPGGAIPWHDGAHTDPWNHVEAAMGLTVAGRHTEAVAAYRWLADVQHQDGSFANRYPGGTGVDTNFTAYVATGVWHHLLAAADPGFAHRMWPTVRAALDYVCDQQHPDGTIPWMPGTGTVLLAGSASIFHALGCGIALAARLGRHPARWPAARARLGAAITGTPERFTPKPHAMDWYYPVLSGAITGTAATARLRARWPEYVARGLGVRCVSHEPWVTGGETCELVLTLVRLGHHTAAARLLRTQATLRGHDGSYWTGYQYADREHWPDERTTWTAGAVLLATAAVAGDAATRTTFST